jgi:putative transposase
MCVSRVTCWSNFEPSKTLWDDGSSGWRSDEEEPIHRRAEVQREADRSPVAEVAKKHRISDVTIYAWRKRFRQLEPVDVKRLRQLEQENAKLKKLVAERDLEIDVMKEVAAKKKW